MTGFEIYLKQNGWELSGGSLKDFSTYDNCNRSWSKDGKSILIGLAALHEKAHDQIFILHPIFNFLPVENFEEEVKLQMVGGYKEIIDGIEVYWNTSRVVLNAMRNKEL